MSNTTQPKKVSGILVISLDFELYWGMFDKVSLAAYGAHLLGERVAIPMMLALFQKYGIHATWALVGMATVDAKETLLSIMPHQQPEYTDATLSSYDHLHRGGVGDTEANDPYHFGAALVQLVQKTAHQEIASHTFSHYYCLEAGQTASDFANDIAAEERALLRLSVRATSIIFPRNQDNPAYRSLLLKEGITAVRGVENHFLFQPRPENKQTLFIRLLRLLDNYVPLSGSHTYPLDSVIENGMANVRASRFLRPYSNALWFLEPLRQWRIMNEMTRAAKQGEIFHLWWHPHNFGTHTHENILFLERVLHHYQTLAQKYGMQSMSMHEVAELAKSSHYE